MTYDDRPRRLLNLLRQHADALRRLAAAMERGAEAATEFAFVADQPARADAADVVAGVDQVSRDAATKALATILANGRLR